MEELEPSAGEPVPAPEQPAPRLRITPEIRGYWIETANWALAFAALMTLYFVISSISTLQKPPDSGDFGGFTTGFMIGALLIAGVITLLPVWFYIKFATLIKKALQTEENRRLEEGFAFLKYHYLFYGILAIIYLVFVVLILVAAFFLATAQEF